MTQLATRPPERPAGPATRRPRGRPGARRSLGPRLAPWRRLSRWQRVVVGAATVAPATIVAVVAAAMVGLISEETMVTVALAAGENPGMVTFGAMYLASPIQWITGRSQIAVRKYLGIVFFLLAASNGAMFAVEEGVAQALGAPFLVAGVVALAAALPLFLTSNRRIQRAMGMRRWRTLHRGVHLVALALLAHVVLIGDLGPGSLLITLGLVARVPAVRRWIQRRAQRRGRGRR